MSSSELGFIVQHFFYEPWTEIRTGCVCAPVCKDMFIYSLRKVNRNPFKYQKYIKVQISLRNPMRILAKNTSSFCLTMTLHSIFKAYSVVVLFCYLPVFFCSCDLFVQKLFSNFTSVLLKTHAYFVCFHCLPVNELSLAHSKDYINIWWMDK